MAWDVLSGVTKTAWDVMSGVTKTAWDVLSGVANLCGMFSPGWHKMAWDGLSRDVLSGSLHLIMFSGVTWKMNHCMRKPVLLDLKSWISQVDLSYACADPEKGYGVRTPLENHKFYRFLVKSAFGLHTP